MNSTTPATTQLASSEHGAMQPDSAHNESKSISGLTGNITLPINQTSSQEPVTTSANASSLEDYDDEEENEDDTQSQD